MRLAPTVALCACVAAAALIGACPRPLRGPALPGCGKDTDCKGERVCENGHCVEPRRTASGASGARSGGAREGSGAGADAGAMPPPIVLPGAAPMFHGGWTHAGRSRYRVTRETPHRIGRLKTGGTIVSSPAITDAGTVIFGSHDKGIRGAALGDDKGLVQRWLRPTGDLVWCSPALGPSAAPDGGAAAGAVAGTVAYVGSDDDRLYALDAEDGAVRWTFTAGPCKRAIGFGPEAARCDVDGVTVGPDGTIYIIADGAYALHPDGTVKWRFTLRTHCGAPPAVGPDGSVYFGCQDGRLYALGADGAKRWDFRAGDDIDSAPAVDADGTVYFGSDDARLYALLPSGALRWAIKTGGDVRSSPALAEDGTIYFGSFDGSVRAARPDGTVAWTFATADRILSSPALDATGVILIGSQDDRLYAIAPDGKLLWSVLFDGDVDGTPAIGPDGAVYVGTDDRTLTVLR